MSTTKKYTEDCTKRAGTIIDEKEIRNETIFKYKHFKVTILNIQMKT